MEELKDPGVVDPGNDGSTFKPIANEGLKYVFKSGRDCFPAKSYHEDGNTDLYSHENLEKREDLRSNPKVREAI